MVYTKKRKAAESDAEMLTGGSGDVNPQFFTMGFNTQSANDTPVIQAYALPIPRLKTQADRQLVMEMLNMKFMNNGAAIPVAAATSFYYIAVTTNPSITSSTSIGTMQADPRTLADWGFTLIGDTAVSPSVTPIPLNHYVDMTDGAGHGVLLATDQLYIYVSTLTTGAHSFAGAAKLLFRFKEVDLQDYIGIVQGQQ